MNILEIYKKYKQMPNLAEHQLRVAAVAKQICESLSVDVDEKTIITACLLHDTGNILKFDLERFPQFNEPEGLAYWEKVKADLAKDYGTDDEHHATMLIAKELGVSEAVLNCIDHIGFAQADSNQTQTLPIQVCAYADMRVGPFGVLSLDERNRDGRERYKNHKNRVFHDDKHLKALFNIEQNIFKNSKIKPKDITDESIAPIVEQLKSYKI